MFSCILITISACLEAGELLNGMISKSRGKSVASGDDGMGLWDELKSERNYQNNRNNVRSEIRKKSDEIIRKC